MQTRLRWVLGAVVGFAALVGLWGSIASAVSGGDESEGGEGEVECLAIDCVVDGDPTPSTTQSVPGHAGHETTTTSTTTTAAPTTTTEDPTGPTGDPELPATGAPGIWLATLGAALVAAGVVVLGFERRRAVPVPVSLLESQRRR